MSKLFWNAVKASPLILGACFLFLNQASASTSEEILFESVRNTPIEKEPESLSGEYLSNKLPKQVASEFSIHLNQSLLENSFPATVIARELLTTEANNPSEQLEYYNHSQENEIENNPMEQVTNVSQLRDISPGDWAFEALKSLVERYGCIAGYPNATFQGNRSTTRYEFAAGLNSCLQQIERLIASATMDFVRRQDLETLQRLVNEFRSELTSLGTRLDPLENRVGFLEKHQFSVTTKFSGSADFALIGAWGNKKAVPSGQIPTEDLNVNTIFPGRMSLYFDTSFSGRDRLRTKLEAGNYNSFNASVTGTDMTLYDFDTRTGPTGNRVVLGTLLYQFPIGNRSQIFIAPQGLGSPDVAPQMNPAVGVLSRFGQRNPIYRLSDGAGMGASLQLNDAFNVSLTYLVDTGLISNPTEKAGLFDGQFGALAQLTFTPNERLKLGLTYVRYYSPDPGRGINVSGNTGSGFAQTPFGDNIATSANAYGIEAQYRFSERFSIGAWVGYTQAQAESAGLLANKGDGADIWNYALVMSFPDLGRKGNSLSFVFGMPPRASGNDVASRRDLDTSYRLEGYYYYKVTNNLAITPGLFVVLNPEHNNANDTIFVGTLLMTFTF